MLPQVQMSGDGSRNGANRRFEERIRAVRPLELDIRSPSPPRADLFTWAMRFFDAVARFTVSVGRSLTQVGHTVCSTLTAEFLAGCAAYAYAMYPCLVLEDEYHSTIDSAPPSGRRGGERLPAPNRDTSLVVRQLMMRAEAAAAQGAFLQTVSPAPSSQGGVIDDSVQGDQGRAWYASISAAVMSVWYWVRRRHEMNCAMTELHGLDDSALRDIGITRYDIEKAVRGEADLQ
jgi:uncharacterized protein YjiS (DUF1127 family)